MTPFKYVACALAVWEIIEIWRHSALFADWRARVELWEGSFGYMLRCSFCLSPWVAFFCVVAGFDSLLYALGIARLANLGNDLTHAFCRTPGRHIDIQHPGIESHGRSDSPSDEPDSAA